jgi:hypothetical protein
MSEYDNENRGAIWRNEKKQQDTHPDFTGSLNVGGVDYWVSAWKRKEGAGPKSPALSFSVKPKDEAPAKRAAPAADPFADDEINF